jgi:site-specific DNA recombinase
MNNQLTSKTTYPLTSARPVGNGSGSKAPRNGFRFNVLAYMRVSVNEERTGSHTFETQRERIRQKLDAVYGLDSYDIEVLTDNGISGAYGPVPTVLQRGTRESLRQIQTKLLSGRYDCLIVYNLSRLVRSPRWFNQMLEDVILPSGVDFISATQDLNLGNAEGRAMANMLAVMDGLFRDGVVQRNKDAARTRAEAGYYVGQVGYGWEWEPTVEHELHVRRRIFPNTEQAQWILQMKEWYLAGWSLGRIAKELNSLQLPSPSGKALWNTHVVDCVMSNPVHAGLVPVGRNGQQWIRGEHYERRIYDEEVLEQLKSARAHRRKWMTNTAAANHHVLNGIVHCHRCGRPLRVSSANTKYRGYRCETGMSQGQRTCPDLTIRADALEDTVVRELMRLSEEPTMQALLEEEAGHAVQYEEQRLRQEQQQLQTTLDATATRFKRWATAFADGVMDRTEFEEYRNALQAERDALRQRLNEVESALANREQHRRWLNQVRDRVLDISAAWHDLEVDEQREVLNLVVEKLTVDRMERDAIVTIKLHLLPERQIPVMFRSAVNMKRKPTGLQSLTPRHLAVLHHLRNGHRPRQIAQLMGVTYGTVTTFTSQILRKLQVPDLDAAIAMCAERIDALLPTLPLGESASPRHTDRNMPSVTPALMDVLTLLASGATGKEIAGRLNLALPAVAGRRARLLDILGARTVLEAVEKARQQGILT